MEANNTDAQTLLPSLWDFSWSVVSLSLEVQLGLTGFCFPLSYFTMRLCFFLFTSIFFIDSPFCVFLFLDLLLSQLNIHD